MSPARTKLVSLSSHKLSTKPAPTSKAHSVNPHVQRKAWLTPHFLLFLCCSQWPHLASFFLFDPGNVINAIAHITCFWFATLVAPSAWQAAVLSGLAGFISPWFLSTSALGRAWYGLAGCFVSMRLFQMISKPAHFQGTSYRCRLAFLYWIGADLRTAMVIEDAKELREHCKMYAVRAVKGVSICTASQLLLVSDAPATILPAPLLRPWQWTLSLAFFYNSLLMLDVAFAFPLALANGVRLAPMMVEPFKSTSLQDFWANRWDIAVQTLLKDCAYVPLRKLGCSRHAAVFGTFVASAFLHTYGIMLGGVYDLRVCGSMMAFFCLQPALMKVEDVTGFKHPIALLLMASVLFVEPICILFENLKEFQKS